MIVDIGETIRSVQDEDKINISIAYQDTREMVIFGYLSSIVQHWHKNDFYDGQFEYLRGLIEGMLWSGGYGLRRIEAFLATEKLMKDAIGQDPEAKTNFEAYNVKNNRDKYIA